MEQRPKHLVMICGPTASGKTGLAIGLASHYRTCIISTDSRQVYREMMIGTACPIPEELAKVPHHFIHSRSIHEPYSAGRYEADVIRLLDRLFHHHDVVVAAGGTGLYIRAITDGLDDIPAVDEATREEVRREYLDKGFAHLQHLAMEADPEAYACMDTENPRRLMRLVEVYRVSGLPQSAFFGKRSSQRRFQTIKIGIQTDRELLYDRINRRVDRMMAQGLLQEVRSLYAFRHLQALQTVGYTELFDHLEGRSSLDDAVTLIKRNTRRYAKRQMTWFRRDEGIRWFPADKVPDMIRHIDHMRSEVDPAKSGQGT